MNYSLVICWGGFSDNGCGIVLYDGQYNSVKMFGGTHKVKKYCELAFSDRAETIGEYCEDFYKGTPTVTVNKYGKGCAYYDAADLIPTLEFQKDEEQR